jgi:tetratricopeptide (TPR) repeat protein
LRLPSTEEPDLTELEIVRLAWEEHQSIAFAADFVGSALVLNRVETAKQAAEFLLAHDLEVSPVAKALAAQALGLDEGTSHRLPAQNQQARVHQLRGLVNQVPRNPLAWLDLAWEYAAAGHNDRAERAIRTALGLGGPNRVVLRSAARFFVHLHEHDFAHYLIRRSPSLDKDPWLVAAEIATADVAGRVSQNVKLGRRMLESGVFSPLHLSELAGAIGALEVDAGDRKRARKMFGRALEQATENTVAQYTWTASQVAGWDIRADILLVPNAFEASVWERFSAEDWKGVVSGSANWHHDEPFSARPAIIGSGVALALDDLATAEKQARTGLASNPTSSLLVNNLAVALASQDRLPEAVRFFRRIRWGRLTEDERITCTATAGLLSFRGGDVDNGRRLYDAAITAAEARGRKEVAAVAMMYKVREELRSGVPDPAHLLSQAEQAWKGVKTESAGLAKSFLKRLALQVKTRTSVETREHAD